MIGGGKYIVAGWATNISIQEPPASHDPEYRRFYPSFTSGKMRATFWTGFHG